MYTYSIILLCIAGSDVGVGKVYSCVVIVMHMYNCIWVYVFKLSFIDGNCLASFTSKNLGVWTNFLGMWLDPQYLIVTCLIIHHSHDVAFHVALRKMQPP